VFRGVPRCSAVFRGATYSQPAESDWRSLGRFARFPSVAINKFQFEITLTHGRSQRTQRVLIASEFNSSFIICYPNVGIKSLYSNLKIAQTITLMPTFIPFVWFRSRPPEMFFKIALFGFNFDQVSWNHDRNGFGRRKTDPVNASIITWVSINLLDRADSDVNGGRVPIPSNSVGPGGRKIPVRYFSGSIGVSRCSDLLSSSG